MKNKKIYIIISFTIIFLIIVFLFAFKYAEVKNINQNINTVVVGDKQEKKININTADKEALESIDGIGEIRSQKIIDNRPYQSIWQLKKAGFTEQFIKKIGDYITTE